MPALQTGRGEVRRRGTGVAKVSAGRQARCWSMLSVREPNGQQWVGVVELSRGCGGFGRARVGAWAGAGRFQYQLQQHSLHAAAALPPPPKASPLPGGDGGVCTHRSCLSHLLWCQRDKLQARQEGMERQGSMVGGRDRSKGAKQRAAAPQCMRTHHPVVSATHGISHLTTGSWRGLHIPCTPRRRGSTRHSPTSKVGKRSRPCM